MIKRRNQLTELQLVIILLELVRMIFAAVHVNVALLDGVKRQSGHSRGDQSLHGVVVKVMGGGGEGEEMRVACGLRLK